jgi:hypothetical protein
MLPHASRHSNRNTVLLWSGPSELDPSVEVGLFASGLRRGSANTKTKSMVQTFVLRLDMPPHEAQAQALDRATCGTCIFAGNKGCYVQVGRAPVWRSWSRGRIARADIGAVVAACWGRGGMPVRWGSYGDPAAIPQAVLEPMMRAVRDAGLAWTGYTAQWRDQRFAWLRPWTHASVHSRREYVAAVAAGWRVFASVTRDTDLGVLRSQGLLPCPSTLGASCATCALCCGTSSRTQTWSGAAIHLHGPTAKRAALAILEAR